MRKSMLLFLILVLIAAPAAWAEDPDYTSVINERGEYHRAWQEAPLGALNFNFVSEPPTGYGKFTKRDNTVYNPLDKILIYFEPVGYTARQMGDQFNFGLSADFMVKDKAGVVIGAQPNFYQWSENGRTYLTEVMVFMTINLQGLEPGEYKIILTLHDKNSDKTGVIERQIVLQGQ